MQSRGSTISSPRYLLLLLCAFGLGCFEAPLAPVAPTSDIQLSIPLINRTKTLLEFTSKDTLLKTSPDGSYFYASSQSMRPMGIDTLKFTPKAAFQQVNLGVFLIDPPSPFGDTLNYEEITGNAPPPVPVLSPDQTFPLPSIVTTPAASFENATFESGTITLSVHNTFPVAIDFPDPIIIKNRKTSAPMDTNEIARLSFAGKTIQPGKVSTVSTSLANVTIQNSFSVLSFRMHAQASSGSVAYTPLSGIEYLVTLSNLAVRSAKAIIPSQSLLRTTDTVITVDDSVSLQSAYFRSGAFDVVFQNNIDVNATISLTIRELQDKTTGAPFAINTAINSKETVRIPVNAANLKVQSSSTGIGTRLTLSATVGSIESQVPRQISSTDFLRVDFQPRSAFIIQSITGRIKPTPLSISAGASGINLGEVSDKLTGNVTLDSVRLALRLSMSGGFPTDYNLYLVAMNRRVSPAHIDSIAIPPPVGSTLRRIFPAQGRVTQIVLDNSTGFNNFLSHFFPNVPDTFIVRGSALMNPSDIFPTAQGIQTIYDSTKVYASTDLSFPLKLGLAGGETSETVVFTDGQKLQESTVKSIKTGTMYFEVTNGLPLQLVLQSAFLGKSTAGKRDTLFWIPNDGPRTIAAAPVDQGGSVTSPRTTAFSIQLKQSDIDKYNDADAIWYRLQVSTTGGGSVAVKVRTTDFVTVRASATMVYTVNQK
ncbi:MAG: hypothetical protein NTZ35_07430 [Ignavibacteriales bacterium]|nr:hypothetical protein [Ignavibacteriales bacterium]